MSARDILQAAAGVDIGASGAWDVSNLVYDNVFLTGFTSAGGMYLREDGLKLYMMLSGQDDIAEITMTTPFDLSTASIESAYLDTTLQDSAMYGMTMRPDGKKAYAVGQISDSVFQYTLGTAWDISTGSYDSVSLYVGSQDGGPSDICFNYDGTELYVSGNASKKIYQYSLYTAYDISTASYTGVTPFAISVSILRSGIFIKPDGTKIYVVADGTDGVYQYTLNTPFDITTATYDSVYLPTATIDSTPRGVAWTPDGTRLFYSGDTNNAIYQFSIL